MAENQVIHGSNRVIEHPNRFQLNSVSGQANTYDLEAVTGEVISNGTPYSKNILDKIDNTLSYLTPSVEQEEIINEYISHSCLGTNGTGISNRNTTITQKNVKLKFDTFEVIGDISVTMSTTPSSTYKHNVYIDEFGKNLTGNVTAASSSADGYVKINYKLKEKIYIKKYSIKAANKQNATDNSSIILKNNNNVINTLTYLSTGDDTQYFESNDYIEIDGIYLELYCKKNQSSNTPTYSFVILDAKKFEPGMQNQFTLDNNGNTFTNNQRILIETPIARHLIYKQLYDDINWTTSVDGKTITNTKGQEITADYVDINLPLIQGFDNNNATKAKIADSTDFPNGNITIDLKDEYYLYEIQSNISFSNNIYSVNIKYSLDGNSWNLLYNMPNNDNDQIVAHSINSVLARYIKVETNYIIATGYVAISEFNIIYGNTEEKIYEGMTLDEVTSNTLNGIEISTLLQPNEKYALVFSEEQNKFILDELMKKLPLYDITISEPVNSIELAGISDKLENGKLYALIVIGKSTANTSFCFGTEVCGILRNSERAIITLFSPYFDDDGLKRVTAFFANENDSFELRRPRIEDYEKIYISNTSYNFDVGTRIIISEVS